MTTTDTNTIKDILVSALFDDSEQSLVEEVGTLVFQSALMRYYTLHEEETKSFDSFIETHVEHESFMEELCAEYPEFEKLLVSEMQAFTKNVETLSN